MHEGTPLQSLPEYLRTVLPARRRELAQIDSTIVDVLGGFGESFDTTATAFAYEVVDRSPVVAPTEPTEYSFSTNAMVSFALGLFTKAYEGRFDKDKPFSLLTPMLTRDARLDLAAEVRDGLRDVSTAARAKLAEEVNTALATATSSVMSRSETFGPDDPFTVGWILELYDEADLQQRPAWLNRAKTVIEERLSNIDEGARLGAPHNRGSSHALTLLRTLQSVNRLRQISVPVAATADLQRVKRWFEEKVHLHLSYAAIPDSSFDAPELVFALEGLLLCDPRAHGLDRLVRRILDVIAEKQQHNPNLRPYRPVLSTSKGAALLPLTIEVFNSLLRTAERFGIDRLWSGAMGSVRPIVSRYVEWLLGQRTIVETNQGKVVSGWHSEHTHTDRLIHVWETSQVLVFLKHYSAWIDAEVQREILDTQTFTISEPRLKDYQPTAADQAEENEPDATVRLYRLIWDDYVTPRLTRNLRKPHFSMLLYGPPGTGKTTFPSYLAALLKWPLITITPSDFIVGGEQLVEERAKAIFTALEQLSDKVILFDEIDRLILNRDIKQYEVQRDIFQFMTPSMLVKLADLRRKARCIFVISTNYEERIDPAIKRSGRIDDRVAVLPPDAAQRKRMLLKTLKKRGVNVDPGDAAWGALLRHSELHTFVSLQDAVDEVFGSATPTEPIAALTDYFTKHPAEITLAAYASRFNVPSKVAPLPETEFRRLYERLEAVAGDLGDAKVKEIASKLKLGVAT